VIVVFLIKNTSSLENNKGSKPKKTPSIPPRQEEQDDCPYNENMVAFSSHYRKEDLAQ